MKDTLEYIITHIVDHPDEVIIEEEKLVDKTKYILHVNQEDMGKVIGKQGRVIKAIRDILRVIATRERVYVELVLNEETQV